MAISNRRSSGAAHLPFWAAATLMTLCLSMGSDAAAHGGGLDAQGCHNNRKTGDYHCHRAQPAASPRPQQLNPALPIALPVAARLASPIPDRSPALAAPQRPVCHTGPRGGTYTITASGRKNYGGC